MQIGEQALSSTEAPLSCRLLAVLFWIVGRARESRERELSTARRGGQKRRSPKPPSARSLQVSAFLLSNPVPLPDLCFHWSIHPELLFRSAISRALSTIQKGAAISLYVS